MITLKLFFLQIEEKGDEKFSYQDVFNIGGKNEKGPENEWVLFTMISHNL